MVCISLLELVVFTSEVAQQSFQKSYYTSGSSCIHCMMLLILSHSQTERLEKSLLILILLTFCLWKPF